MPLEERPPQCASQGSTRDSKHSCYFNWFFKKKVFEAGNPKHQSLNLCGIFYASFLHTINIPRVNVDFIHGFHVHGLMVSFYTVLFRAHYWRLLFLKDNSLT